MNQELRRRSAIGILVDAVCRVYDIGTHSQGKGLVIDFVNEAVADASTDSLDVVSRVIKDSNDRAVVLNAVSELAGPKLALDAVRWVTVHPNGGCNGGRHMAVNGKGEVVGGIGGAKNGSRGWGRAKTETSQKSLSKVSDMKEENCVKDMIDQMNKVDKLHQSDITKMKDWHYWPALKKALEEYMADPSKNKFGLSDKNKAMYEELLKTETEKQEEKKEEKKAKEKQKEQKATQQPEQSEQPKTKRTKTPKEQPEPVAKTPVEPAAEPVEQPKAKEAKAEEEPTPPDKSVANAPTEPVAEAPAEQPKTEKEPQAPAPEEPKNEEQDETASPADVPTLTGASGESEAATKPEPAPAGQETGQTSEAKEDLENAGAGEPGKSQATGEPTPVSSERQEEATASAEPSPAPQNNAGTGRKEPLIDGMTVFQGIQDAKNTKKNKPSPEMEKYLKGLETTDKEKEAVLSSIALQIRRMVGKLVQHSQTPNSELPISERLTQVLTKLAKGRTRHGNDISVGDYFYPTMALAQKNGTPYLVFNYTNSSYDPDACYIMNGDTGAITKLSEYAHPQQAIRDAGLDPVKVDDAYQVKERLRPNEQQEAVEALNKMKQNAREVLKYNDDTYRAPGTSTLNRLLNARLSNATIIDQHGEPIGELLLNRNGEIDTGNFYESAYSESKRDGNGFYGAVRNIYDFNNVQTQMDRSNPTSLAENVVRKANYTLFDPDVDFAYLQQDTPLIATDKPSDYKAENVQAETQMPANSSVQTKASETVPEPAETAQQEPKPAQQVSQADAKKQSKQFHNKLTDFTNRLLESAKQLYKQGDVKLKDAKFHSPIFSDELARQILNSKLDGDTVLEKKTGNFIGRLYHKDGVPYLYHDNTAGKQAVTNLETGKSTVIDGDRNAVQALIDAGFKGITNSNEPVKTKLSEADAKAVIEQANDIRNIARTAGAYLPSDAAKKPYKYDTNAIERAKSARTADGMLIDMAGHAIGVMLTPTKGDKSNSFVFINDNEDNGGRIVNLATGAMMKNNGENSPEAIKKFLDEAGFKTTAEGANLGFQNPDVRIFATDTPADYGLSPYLNGGGRIDGKTPQQVNKEAQERKISQADQAWSKTAFGVADKQRKQDYLKPAVKVPERGEQSPSEHSQGVWQSVQERFAHMLESSKDFQHLKPSKGYTTAENKRKLATGEYNANFDSTFVKQMANAVEKDGVLRTKNGRSTIGRLFERNGEPFLLVEPKPETEERNLPNPRDFQPYYLNLNTGEKTPTSKSNLHDDGPSQGFKPLVPQNKDDEEGGKEAPSTLETAKADNASPQEAQTSTPASAPETPANEDVNGQEKTAEPAATSEIKQVEKLPKGKFYQSGLEYEQANRNGLQQHFKELNEKRQKATKPEIPDEGNYKTQKEYNDALGDYIEKMNSFTKQFGDESDHVISALAEGRIDEENFVFDKNGEYIGQLMEKNGSPVLYEAPEPNSTMAKFVNLENMKRETIPTRLRAGADVTYEPGFMKEHGFNRIFTTKEHAANEERKKRDAITAAKQKAKEDALQKEAKRDIPNLRGNTQEASIKNIQDYFKTALKDYENNPMPYSSDYINRNDEFEKARAKYDHQNEVLQAKYNNIDPKLIASLANGKIENSVLTDSFGQKQGLIVEKDGVPHLLTPVKHNQGRTFEALNLETLKKGYLENPDGGRFDYSKHGFKLLNEGAAKPEPEAAAPATEAAAEPAAAQPADVPAEAASPASSNTNKTPAETKAATENAAPAKEEQANAAPATKTAEPAASAQPISFKDVLPEGVGTDINSRANHVFDRLKQNSNEQLKKELTPEARAWHEKLANASIKMGKVFDANGVILGTMTTKEGKPYLHNMSEVIDPKSKRKEWKDSVYNMETGQETVLKQHPQRDFDGAKKNGYHNVINVQTVTNPITNKTTAYVDEPADSEHIFSPSKLELIQPMLQKGEIIQRTPAWGPKQTGVFHDGLFVPLSEREVPEFKRLAEEAKNSSTPSESSAEAQPEAKSEAQAKAQPEAKQKTATAASGSKKATTTKRGTGKKQAKAQSKQPEAAPEAQSATQENNENASEKKQIPEGRRITPQELRQRLLNRASQQTEAPKANEETPEAPEQPAETPEETPAPKKRGRLKGSTKKPAAEQNSVSGETASPAPQSSEAAQPKTGRIKSVFEGHLNNWRQMLDTAKKQSMPSQALLKSNREEYLKQISIYNGGAPDSKFNRDMLEKLASSSIDDTGKVTSSSGEHIGDLVEKGKQQFLHTVLNNKKDEPVDYITDLKTGEMMKMEKKDNYHPISDVEPQKRQRAPRNTTAKATKTPSEGQKPVTSKRGKSATEKQSVPESTVKHLDEEMQKQPAKSINQNLEERKGTFMKSDKENLNFALATVSGAEAEAFRKEWSEANPGRDTIKTHVSNSDSIGASAKADDDFRKAFLERFGSKVFNDPKAEKGVKYKDLKNEGLKQAFMNATPEDKTKFAHDYADKNKQAAFLNKFIEQKQDIDNYIATRPNMRDAFIKEFAPNAVTKDAAILACDSYGWANDALSGLFMESGHHVLREKLLGIIASYVCRVNDIEPTPSSRDAIAGVIGKYTIGATNANLLNALTVITSVVTKLEGNERLNAMNEVLLSLRNVGKSKAKDDALISMPNAGVPVESMQKKPKPHG